MRNLTFLLTLASIAITGCGSNSGSGDQNNQFGEGTGGAPFGASGFGGGAAPGAGATGAGAVVGGGAAPAYGGTPGAGAVTGGGAVGGVPSGGVPNGGAPSGGGAAPPVGGGGGSVGGAGGYAAGTGGAAAGSGGGSTYVAPPGAVTATLALSPFQIMAGQESYMCQNYDNPFGGKDTAVQDIVSDMTQGAHHMHIFYGTNSEPATQRALEPCSGLEFHPLLYASQTPHQENAYPADEAAMVKGTTDLRMQIHILNTTTSTLNVSMQAKLTGVDPSSISKWVATIYYNNLWLSVPSGQSTSSTTCLIPSTFGPIGLIGGGSHMHSRGIHFVANTSTGVKLYDTTQWEEPSPAAFDPPIMLNPGDSITWACTYQNNSTTTLTFGEHAATNEMCIFVGSFFSSPSGDMLECQSYVPNGQTGISAVAQ